jgi:UDP-glucose 4-epimerase
MPAISGGNYVVVSGASLLGSYIGEQLLAGAPARSCFSTISPLGSTDNIGFLLGDKRCSFIRGDTLRVNELFDALAGAAGVFAVAGFLGAPMIANPRMGIDVNVRGARHREMKTDRSGSARATLPTAQAPRPPHWRAGSRRSPPPP